MSELGETFSALHEMNKERKEKRSIESMKLLQESGIEFKQFTKFHLRVGEYDFWPTTGMFIHMKTKKKQFGIGKLINILKNDRYERNCDRTLREAIQMANHYSIETNSLVEFIQDRVEELEKKVKAAEKLKEALKEIALDTNCLLTIYQMREIASNALIDFKEALK